MDRAATLSAIQSAIGAHGKWKFNLKVAISHGKSDVKVEDVKKCDACEFGKWLYGDSLDENFKQSKPYEVITRLHKEFHICAAEVLKHALNDNKETASNLLTGEFLDKSETLIRALNKLKNEVSNQ